LDKSERIEFFWLGQQRSYSLPAHLCDFELEKNIFLLKPKKREARAAEVAQCGIASALVEGEKLLLCSTISEHPKEER
jgi:hypothetical protein